MRKLALADAISILKNDPEVERPGVTMDEMIRAVFLKHWHSPDRRW